MKPLWLPVTLLISLVGLAGIPDDTTSWGRIVRDYAPWMQNTWVITALLGVGLVLLSLYWGNVIANFKLSRLAEQHSSPRSEWEKELRDLRFDRRDFLRMLEMAYAHWDRKPDPDRSLGDVVRSASMPSDLPLEDNSKFPDWAWAAEGHCVGDAKQLLEFASAIYIACKPPRVVRSALMGDYNEFDRFDTIRMELAKFWDHWGRQEPLEQVIREQKADRIVKAHASEIKLLTFLEIARVRWADSDVPGKSGLFRLGRRNAEIESQSPDGLTV